MRTPVFALGAALALLVAPLTSTAAPEQPPSTGAARPATGADEAPPSTGAARPAEPGGGGGEPGGEPGGGGGGGEPGGGEPGGGGGEPGGEPGARPTPGAPGARPSVPKEEEESGIGGGPSYWRDIKVVPRKLILKQKRVELMPVLGVTLNDNLIRHYLLGAGLQYHISDVLSFGISGHYYMPILTERNYLVGLQQRVLPTLNKYIFAALAEASYDVAYGKFAVHNHWILQFGAFITGGVGVTMTEVIPRNAAHEPWTNYNVTVSIGVGFRMFILRWLTLWVSVKDYMMPDKYESGNRDEPDGELAKKNGVTRFINNFVLQFGITFFLPPDFKYTTFK